MSGSADLTRRDTAPPDGGSQGSGDETLRQWLLRLDGTPLSTPQLVRAMVPLMRQVAGTHEAGSVAPLDGLGALKVADGRLFFEQIAARPSRLAFDKVRALEGRVSSALELLSEGRTSEDTTTGEARFENLQVARTGDELQRPSYVPGYHAWEQTLGHHDAPVDIFVLGLILASLACGLDLDDHGAVLEFVEARGRLTSLNPALHPVTARLIQQMTELDRRRRAQDLDGLAHRLEGWRHVEVDLEFDVGMIDGFNERDRSGKRRAVLSRLEERLFEISKRNPLIHFRPRTNTLNLTLASFPLLLPLESLQEKDILAWWPWLQKKVATGEPLALGSYLSFADAAYLPFTLNKIRLEAARDEREVGFSNLRLVIAFLRWHNLKEDPERRLDSPLLLLPVKLVRKKGVRDQYLLEPVSDEAEINPVLRRHLSNLYGLRLPETLDLEKTDPIRFHELLRQQIQASEPAVEVELVQRPRLHLIHRQAKRTLSLFNRRRRRRRVRSYRDLDYSYDVADFQPLGLRLFQTRVQKADVALESLVEDPTRHKGETPESPDDRPEPDGTPEAASDKIGETDGAAPEDVKQRTFVQFAEGGDTSPNHWEMDLTALTLGNFRYRKMTLVRDYDDLLEQDRENPIFDGLFSVAPRPTPPAPEPLPTDDSYTVLSADPTQLSAVGAARRGDSYIIQGPPGTGKSQTIANLIVDFVARGRRVLFVCQKRAALDVVYLRLKALGLDTLSCLVHDALVDKKAVIHDLRATYEGFLEKDPPVDPAAPRRTRLDELRAALAPLEAFDAAMRQAAPSHGPSAHSLMSRSLQLPAPPETSPAAGGEDVVLPGYGVWHEARSALGDLAASLPKAQADGIYAHHPLACLAPSLAEATLPEDELRRDLAAVRAQARGLMAEFSVLPETDLWDTPAKARLVIELAGRLRPLAEQHLLELLDRRSRASDQLERRLDELEGLRRQLADAEKVNGHWRLKWPADEVEAALGQARPLQGNPFAFLMPSFWRLRNALNSAYDWQGHAVPPTRVQVLERLHDEHRLRREVADKIGDAARAYGFESSDFQDQGEGDDGLKSFVEGLDRLRDLYEGEGRGDDLLRGRVCRADLNRSKIRALHGAKEPLTALEHDLERLFGHAETPLTELEAQVARVESGLHRWTEFLPCLRAAASLDPALLRLLQTSPWTLAELESAVLQRSLRELYRAGLPTLGHDERSRRLDDLADHVEAVRLANVRYVLDRAHGAFRANCVSSSVSSSVSGGVSGGGSGGESDGGDRKRYADGRRILEHEFGKQMRYKSIRDLWSGPAGDVIRDLKPVWLMSPLSVSDTLSLDDGNFDVVIFDEASQIPVEEAIPALFRAPQAIVVGDQMQLPPTQFFASQSGDDDVLLVEEDGESVEYDLSSNSFLSQAAKRLPSTMLGRHYRSRSEALISFSNAAFYGGRLAVVPEERLARAGAAPIEIQVGDNAAGKSAQALLAQAEDATEFLLERAVSSHFIVDGVYDNRRNTREADYIAALVAALLARETGFSLGIVAFSEAQQGEIEQALERLARRDPEFQQRYSAELEREQDGESVGLILKNLENIQGDERDIVILSVCYGPDAKGRCRMAFGPINQAGGEKRLNVAFSRSKHHMAVITSMTFDRITNTYNEGANALRQYLRYAAAASVDNDAEVGQVLRELCPALPEGGDDGPAHPVVEQLESAFRRHGFEVDRRVGRSLLRCDLAVYRPGDEIYRLGILVDTPEHYEQPDVVERDLIKPKLLEAFGWSMATVWTQEWTQDRERVLARLLDRLRDRDAEPVTTDAEE